MMEGQLLPDEREFLYNAVAERSPSIVLEVGTWKGGGSTLQIAMALSLNDGILHTCELDKSLYDIAVKSYEGTLHDHRISFWNISSTELINQLINDDRIPEFVFFDGPEDPIINMNDFKLIEKHLPIGAYFCMHDWDTGVRIDGLKSTKAVLVRPYLEQSNKWEILRSLTAPVSVGIVLAKKRS